MKIANSNISMMSTHYLSQSMSTKKAVTDGNRDFFKIPIRQASITKLANKQEEDLHSIKLQLIRQIFDAIYNRHKTGNYQNSHIDTGYLSPFSVWQRIQTSETFFSEEECTSFASQGRVTTTDGRNIDFNIELSMSRSFTAYYEEYESMEYMINDPLVINLDSDIAGVSDMKFMFDLDIDGTPEEISFAGVGSGFLALDLNGDGIINDGRELFGTKSGDGFRDLAKYDEDKNGWIDENDIIYQSLRVWSKDENGNDSLIDLKQAGVGAIYLGAAKTQFSLTDDNNYVNAYVRATGIYLREDGSAGTINQLDMTS